MANDGRSPGRRTPRQTRHLIASMESLGIGFAKNCANWPEIVKELNTKGPKKDSDGWLTKWGVMVNLAMQRVGRPNAHQHRVLVAVGKGGLSNIWTLRNWGTPLSPSEDHLTESMRKLGTEFANNSIKWPAIVKELNTKGCEKSSDEWIRGWDQMVKQAKRTGGQRRQNEDDRKMILNAVGIDESDLPRPPLNSPGSSEVAGPSGMQVETIQDPRVDGLITRFSIIEDRADIYHHETLQAIAFSVVQNRANMDATVNGTNNS